MNIDSIRAYCLNFPRATEKLQWGDDLCFKVAGKIFTILGLDNPRLCFKCNPEVFAELIEREDIRPAPYVGRYKWVMLHRLDAVSDSRTRRPHSAVLQHGRRESSKAIKAEAAQDRKKQVSKKEEIRENTNQGQASQTSPGLLIQESLPIT